MDENALLAQGRALLDASFPAMVNLSNAAALLWQNLDRLNWAGFYLLHDGALWLGPFQGKPACARIALERGVCGAAFTQNQTLLVPDVHAFPGHIACDAASRSELVIPLRAQGAPYGVLDLDSPELARFAAEDAQALEAFAAVVEAACAGGPFGYDLRPGNGTAD